MGTLDGLRVVPFVEVGVVELIVVDLGEVLLENRRAKLLLLQIILISRLLILLGHKWVHWLVSLE